RRKLAFSSRFYQRFKHEVANHVCKPFASEMFFNSSSSQCCPEPFFHYEKCMKSIFKVLRWTKH
ncbi:unnamed protein product, partial [Staurois parvus]